MKKILSVLCVLAFIASFACISVSADDAAAPSFTLVAAPVEEGAETVTVSLVANLPAGTNVAQVGFNLEYDEALELTEAKNVYAGAMYMGGQTLDVKPYPILWILGIASLPEGESAIVELTFKLPADAAVGSTYEVSLLADENNLAATVDGEEYADAAISGCTLEVVAPVIETTTVTSETEPVVSESEPAASESKAPEASESKATEATSATETEATTKPAPQTGDNTSMMFVVVAVMVVALGAAVVVKKVNVK